MPLDMKFTKEQRKMIKLTKASIKVLQAAQSDIYSELLNRLDLNQQAEDWLFDYIFNDYGSIKNIEEKNTSVP